MARLEDLPWHLFNFVVIVKCSVLSRECRRLSTEAQKVKDRGAELIEYLKLQNSTRRLSVLSMITWRDKWLMWSYIDRTVTRSGFIVFLYSSPFTFYLSTEYNNATFGVSSSAQQTIEIQTLYTLLQTTNQVCHPSVESAIRAVARCVESMSGFSTGIFTDAVWSTCPMYFYLIDLSNKFMATVDNVVLTRHLHQDVEYEQLGYGIIDNEDDVHAYLSLFVDSL